MRGFYVMLQPRATARPRYALPTIELGGQATDFTLPNQDCEPVSLRDLRGRRVVLYFYPKADTPRGICRMG